MKNNKAFVSIIEASQLEILELMHFSSLSTFEYCYAEIISNYLKGDVESLKSLSLPSDVSTDEAEFLSQMQSLRLAVRKKDVSLSLIKKIENLAPKFPEWSGEVLFVLGLAYENVGDQHSAKATYLKSTTELSRIGAHKKSLKAYHNYVASESRINPEKRLTVEFHFIYKKARAIGDFLSAGTALNNLSREYQIVGSLQMAHKYARRAVLCLKKDRLSLNYANALLHLCHILCDLSALDDARKTLEEIMVCPHLEVKSAAGILASQFSLFQRPLESEDQHLLPTWKERKEQLRKDDSGAVKAHLGELESKLIEILSRKRCDKFELIDLLYEQSSLDFEVLENRFKNVLSRIRKKNPSLIVQESGIYSLQHDQMETVNLKIGS